MPAVINGRPRRFAEFNTFYSLLPKEMEKRPRYLKGVGVFRGARGDTAWVKISLPNGAIYNGKSYKRGASLEIKVGHLASWDWEKLVSKQAELQGKAERSEPLQENAPIMFKAWAEDWLSRAQTRTKSPKTLSIHVRKHLLPTFGTKAINTITAQDVNHWVSKQMKSATPGTVKRQFNTLRAILTDSQKAGHISANPCRFADKIKGIAVRQRFLEGTELQRLLNVTQTECDWLHDYILWAIHSGMRKSEILRLTWKDIRYVNKEQTIIQIQITKADKPRAVTCTHTMLQILDLQAKRRKPEDERVFPIAEITLRRHWNKVRKKAKLTEVVMHDLRRTHATHAAASGVDLRTLQHSMGHSSLEMMQTTYAVVGASASVKAATTFESTFQGLLKVDTRRKARIS